MKSGDLFRHMGCREIEPSPFSDSLTISISFGLDSNDF